MKRKAVVPVSEHTTRDGIHMGFSGSIPVTPGGQVIPWWQVGVSVGCGFYVLSAILSVPTALLYIVLRFLLF